MSLVIPGIRSVNQNKVALMAVLEPERSLAEVFLEQLPLWLITNEKGVSKTLSILEKAPPERRCVFWRWRSLFIGHGFSSKRDQTDLFV